MQDILIEIAKAQVPKLAEEAIAKLVGTTEEGSVERSMALILQGWVAEHGIEVAGTMFEDLQEFLNGKEESALKLGMSASELTKLTDALQELERKDRQQVRMWARTTGVLVNRFGRLMARAMLQALTK